MKRSILTIFIVSLSLFAFSQKFNGGAMIGIAASQVAGDNYSGFNKAGPLGGFFINLQPWDHSSFQFELFYIQKGSKKNANYAEGDDESYLLRLNYIEVPLLYQFHIGWFALEAGPSVAFYMSHEETYMEETVNADDFATATFQLNLGIVFTIAQNWKFGIRTNNAMTNLRKDTHTGHVRRIFPNNYGQFNDVLQFTFSYQFLHFGK